MDLYLRLLPVAALLVCAASCWRRSRSATSPKRRGNEFARRNLAEVEGRFVPVIDDRHRRQERVNAALASLAALGLLLAPVDPETLSVYPAVCVVLGMLVVGLALQSAWEASRPLEIAAVSVRTARVRVVVVHDLVRPWARIGAWVGSGAVIVGIAGSIVARDSSTQGQVALAAAVAAVLAAVCVTEATARRVCRAPEPAADAAQLYWQDALRGESVARGYAQVLMAAAFLGMANGKVANAGGLLPTEAWSLAGVALLGASVAAQLADHREPWFRQRLWSSLADGEVVRPGRQLVP